MEKVTLCSNSSCCDVMPAASHRAIALATSEARLDCERTLLSTAIGGRATGRTTTGDCSTTGCAGCSTVGEPSFAEDTVVGVVEVVAGRNSSGGAPPTKPPPVPLADVVTELVAVLLVAMKFAVA